MSRKPLQIASYGARFDDTAKKAAQLDPGVVLVHRLGVRSPSLLIRKERLTCRGRRNESPRERPSCLNPAVRSVMIVV